MRSNLGEILANRSNNEQKAMGTFAREADSS